MPPATIPLDSVKSENILSQQFSSCLRPLVPLRFDPLFGFSSTLRVRSQIRAASSWPRFLFCPSYRNAYSLAALK